ncbi:MAG: hypothetical protein PVJ09_03865 [Candidatus Woesebacteria bacterium]|jgi:hypothetical protein
MKRGPVIFNQAETNLILQSLATNTENQLLISKLQATLQAETDSNYLLLSEEELELIIDNLPAPTANQDPNLNSLRQNIQTQLSNLRNN